jgi:hypothetical protein
MLQVDAAPTLMMPIATLLLSVLMCMVCADGNVCLVLMWPGMQEVEAAAKAAALHDSIVGELSSRYATTV